MMPPSTTTTTSMMVTADNATFDNDDNVDDGDDGDGGGATGAAVDNDHDNGGYDHGNGAMMVTVTGTV